MKLNVPIRQRLKVIGLLFLFGMSCGLLHAQNPLVKQWDKRFGGTGADNLTCFQQTADGGYILEGTSYSGISGDKTQSNWGDYDYWIVKIDSLGNKQWDKRFGFYGWDVFSSIKQTTDKGYIIGGYTEGIGGNRQLAISNCA